MTKKLDDAAMKLQWSTGQMLLDKETLEPADPAMTPLERLVSVPVPSKIEVAVHFGANWYRNNIWHDAKEMPVYKESDPCGNQILVHGRTPQGEGFTVCNMIDNGLVYTPLTHKEYVWSECKFEQWAYVEDLLPMEGYKEED